MHRHYSTCWESAVQLATRVLQLALLRSPPSSYATLSPMATLVAFSFGSFGDIFTLIDLAHKIVNAVKNVTSPEVKAFLLELDGLLNLLDDVRESVGSIQKTMGATSDAKLLLAVARVLSIVSHCKATFDQFLQKANQDKSRRSLGMIRVVWNGVWEAVVEKGEVESLRRKLNGYHSQLQTALSLLTALTAARYERFS
jgi:hypothetical protein